MFKIVVVVQVLSLEVFQGKLVELALFLFDKTTLFRLQSFLEDFTRKFYKLYQTMYGGFLLKFLNRLDSYKNF